MARHIVLLRGINLPRHKRISMPELREALEDAGFRDIKTYVQSGNVVLSSRATPKTVARKVERTIADRFGLDVDVVVRTRDELAKVISREPFGKVASDPKRFQVTFLAAKPDADVLAKLEAAARAASSWLRAAASSTPGTRTASAGPSSPRSSPVRAWA